MRAAGTAIFGFVAVGEHFDFLHRIQAHRSHPAAIAAGVLVGASIHRDVKLVGAAAVYVAAAELLRALHVLIGRRIDAGDQGEEEERRLAIYLNVLNLLADDTLPALRRVQVQFLSVGAHLDRLRSRSHLQLEGIQTQNRVGVEVDPGAGLRPKARSYRGHAIESGQQNRKDEVPLAVGADLGGRILRQIRRRHRGVWHKCLLRIHHRAGHAAGSSLGKAAQRQHQNGGGERHPSQGETLVLGKVYGIPGTVRRGKAA